MDARWYIESDGIKIQILNLYYTIEEKGTIPCKKGTREPK